MPRDDGSIHLSDYRAPAWRIVHADLEFDLDAGATEVTAHLRLQPDPEQPDAPLRLDGEDLQLLDLRIDGAPLPSDAYRVDAAGLHIEGLDGACTLTSRVRIRPIANMRLEGLYASRGALFTQCEAEGFRRITWFVDRPDVMPTWRITLRAERAQYPVLLANGNPVEAGDLGDGRHFATWHNPHPTPAYLFAVVAGDFGCVESRLARADGREVALAVWAAHEDVPRCRYALGAVERALRWDEERFGRVYDLDVFNVVAAQDFTMGAMENKGLNIFNARYVLADEDTATDADYMGIESVVGHEYFHNWSGNRVTLRDWFQLSLKEGLTVFRDQEFTSDLHSRAVKRIEDVRLLRARQFAEDAGSLAHPVRPPSYREINNFYTLTIYEKGAEIVRMLHTLLGEARFRVGMDLYFARNDGRAATVEDFLAAHAEASGRDLSQFARWYAQAGTPHVEVKDDFDADGGTYTLEIAQRTPPTPGQPDKAPLHLPLRFALYDAEGRRLKVDPRADDGSGDRIELTAARHRLRFHGLPSRPLPAFNQGFCAPVKLAYDYTPSQLGLLARCERDPFNRWDALQRLATGVLLEHFTDAAAAGAALLAALGDLIDDEGQDPAFAAECLLLPDFDTLAEAVPSIDVDALIGARNDLLDRIALEHVERLDRRYHALAAAAAGGLEPAAMSARRLRNVCLDLLTRLDPGAALAQAQFDAARSMTDRLGALRCLVHHDAPGRQAALDAFAGRYATDPLVTDKWIALVASRPHPDALLDVRDLFATQLWTPTNPNRVRAVLGSLSRMNPLAFHAPGGEGYALLAESLPELDGINPQVAARLLAGFESWRRLAGARRNRVEAVLQGLEGRLSSPDSLEMLARLRA
ncbi:aminopeptidase N [Coralloluteibacterium stylophorae]|uniref:Aminopeptidase N n=1 Tax=Coralloluteibacterium stylophorae TaxID=1776034 RepID=A0A8J7VWP0_9GAMM|nr:aminopeptidase N [Coralloluteibacterium stylophorae]MBS7457134.1 aminopeptidase N [Coralloluteibacterium stylophorae]